MKARLVAFGEVQIEAQRYAHDVVIDAGRIRRRRKGPSKALRDQFGHTPLSIAEDIPWGRRRLIVGTGPTAGCPLLPMSIPSGNNASTTGTTSTCCADTSAVSRSTSSTASARIRAGRK